MPIRAVLDVVVRGAGTNATILLFGENGGVRAGTKSGQRADAHARHKLASLARAGVLENAHEGLMPRARLPTASTRSMGSTGLATCA
jgi:hypothetical protein